ncbi:type II toxin-antitoxin system RelE/ParE family toxin [Sphingomonas sp. LY54]|uniref:type II toxin-antitoxin system RelE/ParE family toxin n=1 Tax=Sphingomonas sp. LY54 TaxID=3095343 RepID=UPI002D79FF1B|nr:type II toxin-antitoxin system RelE/ParE family toxin [Sphingomonas sp. LY54]WRP29788.1 type II toxin-antitoxin system RelE/ParE family toxin [Sphingomonas sp. LY54]
MRWPVIFADEFEADFAALEIVVQDELLARAKLLQEFGPTLGRPFADTLEGSKFANMKELRFDAAGRVWRAAFAFDPQRKAVLLVAGDKSGIAQRLFYRSLVRRADKRFQTHLKRWEAGKGE